jgi:hypothetical protein
VGEVDVVSALLNGKTDTTLRVSTLFLITHFSLVKRSLSNKKLTLSLSLNLIDLLDETRCRVMMELHVKSLKPRTL